MSVETLERPQTIRIRSGREIQPPGETHPSGLDPNWGPEAKHAIKAIASMVNGIFAAALIMYSTITLFAWIG